MTKYARDVIAMLTKKAILLHNFGGINLNLTIKYDKYIDKFCFT